MWGLAIGAGLLAAAVTCSESVFICGNDEQCGDGGVCEAVGYCSFPDDACESGRRYAPRSGGGLAGVCVPDDGTVDGGASTGENEQEGSSGSLATSGGSTQGSMSDTTGDETGLTATTQGLEGSTDDSTGAAEGRVTEGLVVLYRLDEGSGIVVHDTSGFEAPLDLELVGSGFSWTAAGLHSDGSGIAVAEGSASKIRVACQATDALTLEAWLTPDYAGQPIATQPARIVTWSLGSGSRNFTLGQGVYFEEGSIPEGYSVRLRTSDTMENGRPALKIATTVPLETQHLVFTRSSDGLETLYRDGQSIATQDVKTGDFSTWTDASDHKFALANEVNLNRGWAGELHLVAIYSRALTEAEVAQNYAVGFED
jgi:hypothetical protein